MDEVVSKMSFENLNLELLSLIANHGEPASESLLFKLSEFNHTVNSAELNEVSKCYLNYSLSSAMINAAADLRTETYLQIGINWVIELL